MSKQIKRNNNTVCIVERWYVGSKQKERYIMSIEQYTTPERLHELQTEFKRSKGKIPTKERKERQNNIVRLSDEDIDTISTTMEDKRTSTYTDEELARHEKTLKRIKEKPSRTIAKQSISAFSKKYGTKSHK